MSDNNQ